MIIRSQDKRDITDDLNVYIVLMETSRENEVNAYIRNATRGTIGRYSTEEKAIKVLDMIQEAYCKMKNSDCIFSGSSIDLCKASQEKIDHFIETNRRLYVFELPQDSEV
jgi:hypothetical protein